MRLRTVSLIAVAAALAATAPAQAEDVTYFGDPTSEYRYNDGELAVVDVTFGLDRGDETVSADLRPVNAQCAMVIERSGTNTVAVDVVATATAGADSDLVRPVSTGVQCTARMTDGTALLPQAEAAGPTGVAAGWRRYILAAGSAPVTVCARPSVHWSDNTYQISADEFCA